jgi:uncharacterized membrane protein YphA (DoxX/SURF4 family)
MCRKLGTMNTLPNWRRDWSIGVHLYGVAAVGFGLVGFAWRDFALVWQPVPPDIPGRAVLACLTAAIFLFAGIAVQLHATAAKGAAVLVMLYSLCVLLLHVPTVIAHPAKLSSWAGVAEQLALVAGGLLAYALTAHLSPLRTQRVWRLARLCYVACLFSFGLVHFVFLTDTASLVPKWLPPSPEFWAYATGIADWLAALAILSGIYALAAARLLTLMFIVFGVLVHIPALLAEPRAHMSWVANVMNLALVAAAWLLGDWLRERKRISRDYT